MRKRVRGAGPAAPDRSGQEVGEVGEPGELLGAADDGVLEQRDKLSLYNASRAAMADKTREVVSAAVTKHQDGFLAAQDLGFPEGWKVNGKDGGRVLFVTPNRKRLSGLSAVAVELGFVPPGLVQVANLMPPAPGKRRRAYAEPPPGACQEELISGKRQAAEAAAASAAAQAAVEAAVQAAEDAQLGPNRKPLLDMRELRTDRIKVCVMAALRRCGGCGTLAAEGLGFEEGWKAFAPLNGKMHFASPTGEVFERVKAVAEELGYVPAGLAESPDEGSDFDDESLWDNRTMSGRRRRRGRLRLPTDKAPAGSSAAARSSSSTAAVVTMTSKVDELARAVLGKEKMAQTAKFGLTKTIREIVAQALSRNEDSSAAAGALGFPGGWRATTPTGRVQFTSPTGQRLQGLRALHAQLGFVPAGLVSDAEALPEELKPREDARDAAAESKEAVELAESQRRATPAEPSSGSREPAQEAAEPDDGQQQAKKAKLGEEETQAPGASSSSGRRPQRTRQKPFGAGEDPGEEGAKPQADQASAANAAEASAADAPGAGAAAEAPDVRAADAADMPDVSDVSEVSHGVVLKDALDAPSVGAAPCPPVTKPENDWN